MNPKPVVINGVQLDAKPRLSSWVTDRSNHVYRVDLLKAGVIYRGLGYTWDEAWSAAFRVAGRPLTVPTSVHNSAVKRAWAFVCKVYNFRGSNGRP